jgi:hypothetical protein
MAKKKDTPVPSQNQFSEALFKIAHRFSLFQVFDDFLTMSIAACTQNSLTKLSYYEDEYLETIARYKDSDLRHEFPKAFSALIFEMEDRVSSDQGNDVLGDFFEQHISNGRNGQYFTPYHICKFMASITHTDRVYDTETTRERFLRILDPSCGSGRMLLAGSAVYGSNHEYYGIDIDRTCVKMAALNLFLNGIWHSEVMCANALIPGDFVIAYHISLLPFGIFKIEEKEQSMLWQLQKNSFQNTTHSAGGLITTPIAPFREQPKDAGTQLGLF